MLFGLRSRWLGLPAAALALATVFATAMIYAQIRSVPRWHSPMTPVLFLLFALAGGALLAGAAARPWLLAALGIAQLAAWRHGDAASPPPAPRSPPPPASARSAGCACSAAAHRPELPLREMVFVIGRRHARKLRVAGLAPRRAAAARLVACRRPAPLALAGAPASHAAGALVLRWLFFAEAEHVVGLYYGRR